MKKQSISALYTAYEQEGDEKQRLAYIAQLEAALEGFLTYTEEHYRDMQDRCLAYAFAILSGKQRAAEKISALLGRTPALLDMLLTSEDAKTRKNTYILLGNLAESVYLPYLLAAAEREQTLFVLPSLILALGRYPSEESREAVEVICRRAEREDAPPRIAGEILRARDKALDHMTDAEEVHFTTLGAPCPMLLTTMQEQRQLIRKTLEVQFSVLEEKEEGFVVMVHAADELLRVRTFARALFYREALYDMEGDAEAVAHATAQAMAEYDFHAMHDVACLRYRITVEGGGDKRAVMTAMSREISHRFGNRYQNSPSRYTMEIIVKCAEKKRVFFSLHAMPDTRYAYRRETLPASIHPTTAAVLCALAARHVPQPASVLDPFCGAATVPAEASYLFGEAVRYRGVDISADAVRKARVNVKELPARIRIRQGDALTYVSEVPFDLVISNMPFGMRVGTHKHNEMLYRGFVARLPQLLSEGGHAVLYTTDTRLLETCIRAHRELRIVATYTMESGGLLPKVTVVRRAR